VTRRRRGIQAIANIVVDIFIFVVGIGVRQGSRAFARTQDVADRVIIDRATLRLLFIRDISDWHRTSIPLGTFVAVTVPACVPSLSAVSAITVATPAAPATLPALPSPAPLLPAFLIRSAALAALDFGLIVVNEI
jgi:hypothetical protein